MKRHDVRHEECCALGKREDFRQQLHSGCLGDGFRRVTTGSKLRHHAITWDDTRRIRARLDHHAGDLEAGNERQVRLVLIGAADHQHVGKVETRRFDRNAD